MPNLNQAVSDEESRVWGENELKIRRLRGRGDLKLPGEENGI